MRTTIRLDDELEKRLREVALGRGKRFGQVVNEVLRAGLGVLAGTGAKPKPFKVNATHCGFRPGMDVEKLNQLVDEMEVDDFESEAQAGQR